MMTEPSTGTPRVVLLPDPNPWDDPTGLPRLSWPRAVLISLLTCLVALGPVFVSVSPAWGDVVAVLLCIVAHLTIMRSPAAALSSLLLYLTGTLLSAQVGIVLLCLVCGTALGAYLVCTLRSWWLLLIPAVAGVAAFALTRDAALVVLSVAAAPAAGILAHCTMRNSSRVSAICRTALMLGLGVTCVLLLIWQDTAGALSVDAFWTLLEETRTTLTQTLVEHDLTLEWQAQLDQMAAETDIRVADLLSAAVDLIFHLLPTISILLFLFLGYAAQQCCIRAFPGTGMSQLMTRSSQLFVLSIPASLVFLFSGASILFLSFFGDSDALFIGLASPFEALVTNLFVLLLPGMFIVGVFKFIADIWHTRRLSLWTVILLFGALFFAPPLLIIGPGVSGAFTTLMRPLFARAILSEQQKNDKNGDDRP